MKEFPWQYERRFTDKNYFHPSAIKRRQKLRNKLFRTLQRNNKVECQLGCGQ